MIESNLGPACGIVTITARLTKCAHMGVIVFMATDALIWRFPIRTVLRVASRAFE
jgi:hypothetical protein